MDAFVTWLSVGKAGVEGSVVLVKICISAANVGSKFVGKMHNKV